MKTRCKNGAFTLVEMIAAIGIVLILALLLGAALRSVKEFAGRAKCLANMRQISLAIYSQAADNDNRFMPVNSTGYGWMYYLAPYLGLKGTEATAPIFKCPSDQSIQLRTYKINATLSRHSGIPNDNIGYHKVSDVLKPSSRILLFDIASGGIRPLIPLWGDSTLQWAPYYENLLPANPPGPYPRMHFNNKMLNALMFDGSVRSITCPVPDSYFYWDEI